MSSRLLLTLLLLLTLIFTMSKALIFDYLVLSLQWPPALCRAAPAGCKTNPNPVFGVHGLWPNVNQGYDPVSCGSYFGVIFDSNVCYDPSIANELNAIWPNYLGKNIDFWRREWESHGTCAYEVFDQRLYFKKVIDLYFDVDIDTLLDSLGYSPEFYQDLNLQTFKQAIARKLSNALPQIRCSARNGMPVEIQEIRICFYDAGMGTQIISCPRVDSFCGTSTVKWYI